MNRKEAILAGSKRYTGNPCVKCDGVERLVRNYECIKCRNVAKVKAAKQKRVARGPVPLGRPRKHSEICKKYVPKKVAYIPKRKHPKPTTEFEHWICRSRKKSVQRREIPYTVYKALFVTHCPLLNIELTYEVLKESTPTNYASLDRIDPSKGYVEGNIQILSHRANTLKNDATVEELELIIKNWKKTS